MNHSSLSACEQADRRATSQTRLNAVEGWRSMVPSWHWYPARLSRKQVYYEPDFRGASHRSSRISSSHQQPSQRVDHERLHARLSRFSESLQTCPKGYPGKCRGRGSKLFGPPTGIPLRLKKGRPVIFPGASEKPPVGSRGGAAKIGLTTMPRCERRRALGEAPAVSERARIGTVVPGLSCR